MNEQRRRYVAIQAIEEAFGAQIGKLFGVFISADTPEEGLKLFKTGFTKAIVALDAIEKELGSNHDI